MIVARGRGWCSFRCRRAGVTQQALLGELAMLLDDHDPVAVVRVRDRGNLLGDDLEHLLFNLVENYRLPIAPARFIQLLLLLGLFLLGDFFERLPTLLHLKWAARLSG